MYYVNCEKESILFQILYLIASLQVAMEKSVW
jgi:hypothetical protein